MVNQNNIVEEGKLLSEQERVAFRMISTGNDLHGQRAIALLAIDEGATQVEAAQQAGLTPGQVKYWLGKFRQVRMEIFPEQVLKADQLRRAQQTADKPKKSKKTKKSKGKKSKKKTSKKSKSKKAKKDKAKKKKKKNKKSKK
jgi:hypothetical protein